MTLTPRPNPRWEKEVLPAVTFLIKCRRPELSVELSAAPLAFDGLMLLDIWVSKFQSFRVMVESDATAAMVADRVTDIISMIALEDVNNASYKARQHYGTIRPSYRMGV